MSATDKLVTGDLDGYLVRLVYMVRGLDPNQDIDEKDRIEIDFIAEKIESMFTQARIAARIRGLEQHSWMRDGVSYVGNGQYTLKEAVKIAADEETGRNVL